MRRIPRCLILTAAGAVVLAASTAVASLVFVLGVGLWPAYRAAGWPSVLWAWWMWLSYDGVRADVAQRWLEIGAASPAFLGGAMWLLWRRFRQAKVRPLYGKTEPATLPEMRDAGLRLKHKL